MIYITKFQNNNHSLFSPVSKNAKFFANFKNKVVIVYNFMTYFQVEKNNFGNY